MARKVKEVKVNVRIVNPESIPAAEINLTRTVAKMAKEGAFKIS
ncbi:MAG: hypothetical protein Q8936_01910 [Bacillota bacterium]|nr:hypothetical protein [Bacillota bacterium]